MDALDPDACGENCWCDRDPHKNNNAYCHVCQRNSWMAKCEELEKKLERVRQAWYDGDDPMCDDVCEKHCKGACGI